MATATRTHPVQSRLYLNRLGLWLFIASEMFLFAALLTSRFYLGGFQRPADLNQPLGLIISVILVASSFTAYRAETAVAHGNQRGFRRNILFTIFLGVLFMAGLVVEWWEGFRFFPPSTGYGTAFFALTGLHGFHVLTGLIVLTIVYSLGRRGRFTMGSYWGVEGAVKYWHFVDVAWVFIYPTLYLVSG